MNTVPAADAWVVRLLRLGALLLAGAALATWVTPVNVPGRDLVPVGCGAPSSPSLEPLTDFVCGDHVANAKSTTLALLLAAAVLLVIGELVLPRVPLTGWVLTVAAVAVVVVPLLALSVTVLFSTVAQTSADGNLIRCGTPLSPATDAISRSICGQLAARDKTLGLAGVALSVVALVGAAYVGRGRGDRDTRRPDDVSTGTATTGTTTIGTTTEERP